MYYSTDTRRTYIFWIERYFFKNDQKKHKYAKLAQWSKGTLLFILKTF